MRRAICLSAVALAVLCALAAPALAGSYFPNRATDTLTYQNLRYGGEVTSRVDSTSGTWQHWTEFAGAGAQWVWSGSTSETLYVWTNGASQLVADLAAARGTSWTFRMTPHHLPGTATISARGVVVRTAAGTFKNCVVLALSGTSADAGTTAIAFAPGVGVVQWYESNIAGSVRKALVRGTINGVAYPRAAASALAVSGWINDYEQYIDGENPSTGSTVASVSMTVRNNTTAAITFQYRSSQRYDIAIDDADGNQVNIMSATMRFMMALGSETLQPGQSRTYAGTIQLFNLIAGGELAPGNYTVRMWLVGTGRAGVSFPIVVRRSGQ